ncbi:protein ELC-like [Curcuma longa]|uniref:protein ELC-like n=1 Tax=Curcuma longa TaxID=136217 RepID=UPI003D9E02B1
MADPAALGAQYVQQFLSAALSQRGPAALPYSEDAKWLIRQHLMALAGAFASLRPRAASFTHDDGRSSYLLQAEGTIPIVYRGTTYNLPASVWLLEQYPRRPPAVFLTPTPDMLVKPGHPLVDPSGLVRAAAVPYLAAWVYPSSNLVDLVRSLSHLFGLDPPLYSRPAAALPQNQSPPNTRHPIPSSSNPSPPRIYSSLPSPYGGGRFPPSPQTQMSSHPVEDPADVFRRNAISKIVENVHRDAASLRRSQESEMEPLLSLQAELRIRGEELSRGVREMVEEKEGLEQQLQLVLMNTDVLEGWVRETEARSRKVDALDVDNVFEPMDALSRQILELTAADLAVEDTIYSLDKAVQEGAITFESYLKSVRTLCREQFFHRATLAKARAVQVRPRVTKMAPRVPLYAS